ncbi:MULTISPECIES: LysR substrate-binding domain-containing protein [unclassified Cupriavidus]|uniref:LysR substrate-binding domain-containing protein n=1 Tax=unclassified Cupriavidus TaxID=2640874 RepID=UPI0009F45A17|nr:MULTISPECIES: LysR substrate-binding domain-containing protein [unclassified Cupriavidus]
MKRGLRRNIPSSDSLVIFEAAARHLSFTRAGEELGLTQGAISRQILDLEAFLEAPLFDRSRRALALTEAGRDYRDSVCPLLDALESATLQAQAQRTLRRAINLSVAASFCNRWLIPKLPGFVSRHPGALVNVSSRVGRIDLDSSPFDAAIINAAAPPPGVASVPLMPIRLVPYASPRLPGARPPLAAAQLRALPLLHLYEAPKAWEAYFQAMGAADAPLPAGAQHTLFLVNCEAALAGLGAALLPPEFVEEDERTGRLLRLAEPALVGDRSYFLIWREAAAERIAPLRAWMLETLGGVAPDAAPGSAPGAR